MRPRRRGERGHLLVWVTVFGIFAMAYWALAFRATGDCIRMERASILRQTRDQGIARALAASIALLRTGTPGVSPYDCVVTPSDASACVATFTESLATPGEWTVEVRAATDEETSSLPTAPARF